MIEDWDVEARRLGFSGEKEMFVSLYAEEGRSISQLAELFGSGTATINRRLDNLGIEKRSRGGDNNQGRQVYKLTHLDQRIVLWLSLDEVAELTGVSRSLWYKYRRQKGSTNGILHHITHCGA